MNESMTKKYYECIDHPSIGCPEYQGTIELTPHMVNPLNSTIEEDLTLNTKLEWWIEYSRVDKLTDDCKTHYWDLDCGGDTAEEAVCNLHALILKHYPDTHE